MKWTNHAKTLSTTAFTHTGQQKRRGSHDTGLGYLSRDIPPCVQSFLANNLSFLEEEFLPRELFGDFKKAEDVSERVFVAWDC